jgi:hypothetical protein
MGVDECRGGIREADGESVNGECAKSNGFGNGAKEASAVER